MSTHRHRNQGADAAPTVREIADLTTRLRALITAGPAADPGERSAFLADKAALLTRIPSSTHSPRAGRGGAA